MADDSHENGTSNGDVPEIELIIKVSLYYAWNEDEEGGRDREKRRSFRARYGRGSNDWFSSCTFFFFLPRFLPLLSGDEESPSKRPFPTKIRVHRL